MKNLLRELPVRVRLLIALSILASTLLLVISGLASKKTGAVDLEVYPHILRKVRETNGSTTLRPAAVAFVDEQSKRKTMGTGTIVLDARGSVKGIITSEHLFPTSITRGRGFYKPLQQRAAVWIPIERVDDFRVFGSLSIDVVWCTPGESALIHGICNRSFIQNKKTTFWPNTEGNVLRSVVSGENIPILGEVRESSGVRSSLLLYDSRGGDSGLGAFADGGKIFVISCSVKATSALREVLPIPASFKNVSLAYEVKLPPALRN